MAAWVSFVLTAASPTLAQAAVPEDRTGAPYLRIDSKAPDADRVPLKETRADVQIAGVIARVRVTQVYRNEGARPLEAVYVFPGSTRAAVFGMRLTVGDRVTVAKIQERDAARRVYEQAKAQGKSASLLEQERPNVFTMNVANILPGDTVKVELDYVEALIPEDGVYELVYPTVVGPRYTTATEAAAPEAFTQNPYLTPGAPVPYAWGMNVKLEAGLGIASVTSPSHRISPRFAGKGSAAIEVDEPQGGNKDFVLRYKLGGDRIESGVLLFPGATPQDDGFFLAMMQPPTRLEPAMIPAREYIFILDVSGSMHGYPLDTAKTVMRELIKNLKPTDRFNVLFFSGGNWLLSEDSLSATPANVDRAIAAIGHENGNGGTEILPALRRALAMKRADGMSTTVVVVTDGYVSVERETFDVIRKNLGTANLFSFGIGSSVNRFIIEGMARAGMGEPYIVLGPEQAPMFGAKLKKQIESPVLTDVTMKFEGFNAFDVEPPSVPDLFAAKPIVVFGKYKGEASGRITVTGRNGQGELRQSIDIGPDRMSNDNVALKYLWARHRIARLADEGQLMGSDVKAEVTKLGLTFNLLTQYTSFVAVDEMVRNPNGGSTKVVQPLPLPAGVEDEAGGESGTASAYGSSRGTVVLGARGAAPGGGGMAIGYGRGNAALRAQKATVAPARPAEPSVAPPRASTSVDATAARGKIDSDRKDKTEEAATKDASIRLEIRAPDHIKRVLQRQVAQLRASWRRADPGMTAGSLRLAFEIGADGKPSTVRVVRASGLGKAVQDAIVKEIERMLFEAGRAKETVEIELVIPS